MSNLIENVLIQNDKMNVNIHIKKQKEDWQKEKQ